MALHDPRAAAQHDRGQGAQVKSRFGHQREQPFGVGAALLPHDLTHRIAQGARPARQHLLNLRVGQGKPCFAPHLLTHSIDAADHAEFQAVRGLRHGAGVVDPHEIHRPSADVHEQQGRLIQQQVGVCQQRGVALREQCHILNGDLVFCALESEQDRLGAEQVLPKFWLVPAKACQR